MVNQGMNSKVRTGEDEIVQIAAQDAGMADGDRSQPGSQTRGIWERIKEVVATGNMGGAGKLLHWRGY